MKTPHLMRGPGLIALTALTALTLALAPTGALAHGGEDHGEAAPLAAAPSAASLAPRASAQTEAYELVVILASPARLLLYLDHYASNAPVEKAQITLESGTFQAEAQPLGPGLYSVDGAAFSAPGSYPLTLTVQTQANGDDSADLLNATLEVGAASTTPAATPATAHPWLTGALAAAGLLGCAALARLALARSRARTQARRRAAAPHPETRA